jgi:hypothetical protein
MKHGCKRYQEIRMGGKRGGEKLRDEKKTDIFLGSCLGLDVVVWNWSMWWGLEHATTVLKGRS